MTLNFKTDIILRLLVIDCLKGDKVIVKRFSKAFFSLFVCEVYHHIIFKRISLSIFIAFKGAFVEDIAFSCEEGERTYEQ